MLAILYLPTCWFSAAEIPIVTAYVTITTTLSVCWFDSAIFLLINYNASVNLPSFRDRSLVQCRWEILPRSQRTGEFPGTPHSSRCIPTNPLFAAQLFSFFLNLAPLSYVVTRFFWRGTCCFCGQLLMWRIRCNHEPVCASLIPYGAPQLFLF